MSDQDPSEESKRLYELLDKHIDALREHFSTVQIFVTTEGSDKEGVYTQHLSRGSGNWFAIRGHCRHWLLEQEEKSRLKVKLEEGEI